MTQNLWYKLLIGVFLLSGIAFAEEQIVDFSDDSLPVINEELRKLRENEVWKSINSVIELKTASDIDVQDKEIKNMRIENRTSDPSSPTVGEIWIRTDL
jgi:hypothetical protein